MLVTLGSQRINICFYGFRLRVKDELSDVFVNGVRRGMSTISIYAFSCEQRKRISL